MTLLLNILDGIQVAASYLFWLCVGALLIKYGGEDIACQLPPKWVGRVIVGLAIAVFVLAGVKELLQ